MFTLFLYKNYFARLAFKLYLVISFIIFIFATNSQSMTYSVAFRNLPFEPENNQVIYVENKYDDRINTIIIENYERLKWHFKRHNLDFVYIPMFFNDEETKEKVLYYAPYLTNDIIEKVELRSSHLLKYMSHLENQSKIVPSLLYAPQKENEQWIFQGMTIDKDGDDNDTIFQCLDNILYEIDEEVESNLNNTGELYSNLRIKSSHMVGEPSEDSPQVEYSSTPSVWAKLKLRGLKFGKSIVEEEDADTDTSSLCLDEIREEGVRDTIEDLERNIERLRLLGIPLAVIVEFVAKYETISRIRLTDDLRIILPDYNNKEVLMGPLYKAVYFLFLNHPEGIVLKHLEEHHHELVNYYLQTSQRNELTPRMIDTINRLEYPGDNTINYTLSRIKAYFMNTIDEHLAKNYFIIGKPGEPYKIALDKISIEWEEE